MSGACCITDLGKQNIRNSCNTTDKGCSVLIIAYDMLVSLVTEYYTTIIHKHLYINYHYYLFFFKVFLNQLQELFLVFEQAGNGILLHWVLEHAGKPNKLTLSQSVGFPSQK